MMDRDTHIPETRVRIDQSFTPEPEQDRIATDVIISIDRCGSFSQLTPGAHQNSTPYFTFPRTQSIANSTPIISRPQPVGKSTKIKSQSSNLNSSMSTNKEFLSHSSTSANQVDIPFATSSPISVKTPRANRKEVRVAINHAALDREPSPDELTCDSGLDDFSMAEEDRLRLHAACLEGRLSVYGREAETWLKERAELSVEAASLRKRLEAANLTLIEVKAQSEREVALAMGKSLEAQGSLRRAQDLLSLKAREKEQLSANLTTVQQDSIYLKSQLTDVQQNSLAKDQALASLREKMSELYADMESIRIAHSQALDNKIDLNAELASLRRSQEWYRDQLQLTEVARDRLIEQLNSTQKWLNQSGASVQQLAQENARLETQVMSGESALSEAKRNLSHELEAIRADILEREAIFEKILAERADLEALCRQKSHQITECQNRISALQSDLIETEMEVSALRSSLDQLRTTLQYVESERNELSLTLSSLETQMNQQKTLMDQQLAQYQDVCSKLNHLVDKSHEQLSSLNRALEEKAALESSLQAAYKEKAALHSYLSQLKDDMSRVESNFSALQCELDSKNSELSNALLIRYELSNDLEVLQAKLQEKAEKVKELDSEREQLQNASLLLQSENANLRDDIRRLEASIAAACDQAADRVRKPLINKIDQLDFQSEVLQTELTGLRKQIVGLLDEQGHYHCLVTNHQELQQKHDSLKSTHTTLMEESVAKQTELRQRLEQVEATYTQALLTKSSEIEDLTSRLSEKANEVLALQSEIASLKAEHQLSITQKVASWAEELSGLEARLFTAETQRNEIEQQLQVVLRRESDASIQQQVDMEILRSEVAKLELRVWKSEDLKTKNRQLGHELEAARGRELGLSDTLEDLKRHVANLEIALSEREAEIIELSDRVEKLSLAPSSTKEEVSIQPVCVLQEQADIPPPLPCYNCQMLLAEVKMHSDSVARMQMELAKTQAALELAKQESTAQSVKTATEAFGRQQASQACRKAVQEVEQLKGKLIEVQQQLSESKYTASTAQANVISLTKHLNLNEESTSSEVQTLREAIQILKQHLDQQKRELAETKQETWLYQSSLSDLRGSLRGLIEQSQLFSGEGTSSTASSTSAPACMNVVEVSELEKLLVDRADDSLLLSKPLVRVSNYLDHLQQEIDTLESQVIHHATVVRDSVTNWRTTEKRAIQIQSEDPLSPPTPLYQ